MNYRVIIKTKLIDPPKDHELSAALILAHHFRSDVVFLRPETRKTPDIAISTRAIARARFYIRTEAHTIKHLKIITKKQKIIDVL